MIIFFYSRTTGKWNHMVCALLGLHSATQHYVQQTYHLTCYFKGCIVRRMCAEGNGKPCFVSTLEKLHYKRIPQSRQCFCWFNCPFSPLNHVYKSSSQKVISLAPLLSLLYLAHTFVNMALDYLSC